MFILSKNKDILIKPISIWIEGTDNENIKNIMMNDGSKIFNMGSYEVEYAKEQIEEILKSLNYEYNFIRMFTDDDIEEFEKSKQYLNFNNVFEPINDEDLPFWESYKIRFFFYVKILKKYFLKIILKIIRIIPV